MAATRIRDLGYNRIVREMALAAKKEVVVGVLNGVTDTEGHSIAGYATDNEFGTDKIPSRPFMRTSFDSNAQAIATDFNKQGTALVTGAVSAQTALTIIGQKQADRIKNTITSVQFSPALSARTIAQKKGSTKTLVDTGAMVNSVQISIRARGSSK